MLLNSKRVWYIMAGAWGAGVCWSKQSGVGNAPSGERVREVGPGDEERTGNAAGQEEGNSSVRVTNAYRE